MRTACRRKTATVTFTYYERVKKVYRNTSYDRNKSPSEPAVNHLKNRHFICFAERLKTTCAANTRNRKQNCRCRCIFIMCPYYRDEKYKSVDKIS